ncbi:DUF1206 domain-containing protein [Acaryochloris sp. CCMEE 5410]|uniref:DUF1206 domain-containing protein n=1 Tax=Acaryochloris sp. CCMEE 5410 TaxID=310037 RepID=UPI0002484DFC|nr:DUF1206 domain-containing protein [Acaryochloris sp. CCMEE 5410]KAI9131980.1 DUF1206 domain-containing protein [Acaryochloris sp. CCMEE 5410]
MGKTRKWLVGWIRFGFLIKGFVYILLGILAARAAFIYHQQAQDIQGILRAIAHQPAGNILLITITVGLAGYSFWRIVEAGLNPNAHPQTLKNGFKRLGRGLSGVAYGALAFTAVQILQGSQQDSESFEFWTARVLSWPMGQWLVGTVGVGFLGVGIAFFYRTWKADFRQCLQLNTLNSLQRQMIVAIGRVGYCARGIILAIIGGYVIKAAHEFDADTVRSSEEALETIKQQPYGPGLLTLVAIGLIAYGIYMGCQARYRRIELP